MAPQSGVKHSTTEPLLIEVLQREKFTKELLENDYSMVILLYSKICVKQPLL